MNALSKCFSFRHAVFVMILVFAVFLELTAGYTYLGCVGDKRNPRTLPHNKLVSADMTPQICVDHCQALHYVYAGTEDGQECFCSNVSSNFQFKPQSDCWVVCTGDSTKICGGQWRLSVYHLFNIVYSPIGCLVDSVSDRTLPYNELSVPGVMTTVICIHNCRSYRYAGLEYGYECFCGNDPSSFVYMPESECNFLCEGAQTEACGAGNRLTAFKYDMEPLQTTRTIHYSTDSISISQGESEISKLSDYSTDSISISPGEPRLSTSDYITERISTFHGESQLFTKYSYNTYGPRTSTGEFQLSTTTDYSTDSTSISLGGSQMSKTTDYSTESIPNSPGESQMSTTTDYSTDSISTSPGESQISTTTDFSSDGISISLGESQASETTDYSINSISTSPGESQVSTTSDYSTNSINTSPGESQMSTTTGYRVDSISTSPGESQISTTADLNVNSISTSHGESQLSTTTDFRTTTSYSTSGPRTSTGESYLFPKYNNSSLTISISTAESQISATYDYSTEDISTSPEESLITAISDHNTYGIKTSSYDETQTTTTTDYNTDISKTSIEETQTSATNDYSTDVNGNSTSETQTSSKIYFNTSKSRTSTEETQSSTKDYSTLGTGTSALAIITTTGMLPSVSTVNIKGSSIDRLKTTESILMKEKSPSGLTAQWSNILSTKLLNIERLTLSKSTHTQTRNPVDGISNRPVTSYISSDKMKSHHGLKTSTTVSKNYEQSLSFSNTAMMASTTGVTESEEKTMDVTTKSFVTSNDVLNTISFKPDIVTATCSNSSQAGSCLWICRENTSNINIDQLKDDAIKGLTFDKKETKAYKNTKVCMSDERPSSRNIGVIGLMLALCPIIFIVAMDAINFVKLIKRRFRKVRKKAVNRRVSNA